MIFSIIQTFSESTPRLWVFLNLIFTLSSSFSFCPNLADKGEIFAVLRVANTKYLRYKFPHILTAIFHVVSLFYLHYFPIFYLPTTYTQRTLKLNQWNLQCHNLIHESRSESINAFALSTLIHKLIWKKKYFFRFIT